MKTQTLNLEASKALHDLGVRVESEKYHYQGVGGVWFIGTATEVANEAVDVGKTTFIEYPTPNLQELFSALPQIVDKLGVTDVRCLECKVWVDLWCKCDCDEDEVTPQPQMWNEYHAHNLLDTYLSGGMEAVSEAVIELIVNK